MTNLVGKQAPNICAQSVTQGKIQELDLSQYKGKYIILFFYPLDFTFVCPTELFSFQENIHLFQERNAQVIACSVDSAFTHMAWLKTEQEKGGIQGVSYPIVADLTKEIARNYGVLKEDEGIAYRGLFLIDRKGIVRHQLINDLPLGRSIEEAIRTLDALIFFEENGEVCPANWKKGSKGLIATSEGLQQYLRDCK